MLQPASHRIASQHHPASPRLALLCTHARITSHLAPHTCRARAQACTHRIARKRKRTHARTHRFASLRIVAPFSAPPLPTAPPRLACLVPHRSALRCTAPHRTVPIHIAWHRNATHRTASYRTESHRMHRIACITLRCIVSSRLDRTIPPHLAPHRMHRTASHRIASHRIAHCISAHLTAASIACMPHMHACAYTCVRTHRIASH